MPINKRESLLFTFIMCFCMVLWMSMYNVTLHMGGFSLEVLKEGEEDNEKYYLYSSSSCW